LLSPEVLLLDEPTSALDPKSAAVVTNHIETLCEESRLTILMVSHGDVFSDSRACRTLVVADGRVKEIT